MAWGYECRRLNKIQKRVIRILNLSKYNDHTEPIFKNLKLLKIEDIFKLNEIKFYYKLENGKLLAYFLNQLTVNIQSKKCDTNFSLKLNNEINEHNARSNKLHITRTNHMYSFAQKCLRQNLPQTKNEPLIYVLNKIKTHSLQRIINDIKELCIANYTEKCKIENCYICNKN